MNQAVDRFAFRELRGEQRSEAVRRALRGEAPELTVTRYVPLDDIRIRAGSGRIVDAYAAVFNVPTEIMDEDGHYKEQNDPAAFNRSIASRASSIFCVYNHGKTLQGTPSDRFSVPIAVPVPGAMKADRKGLFTSSEYNKDPEADRILEAIKSGSLKGMSYTGVFLRSEPTLSGPFDLYRPDRSGELTLVTRLEIALIEYGPTPIPAYDTAQIIGVRAREIISMRTGIPVHHTPIEQAPPAWDEQAHVGRMKFPTEAENMLGQFAIYNDKTGQQLFHANDGALPHHVVDEQGNTGAAHLDAVHRGLTQVDGLHTYSTDERLKARKHLSTHLSDFNAPDSTNTPQGTAVIASASAPATASSGREAAEEHERATAPGPSLAHPPYKGMHVHAHQAHGGPDRDADGIHSHAHVHDNTDGHDHGHRDYLSDMVGSSGRSPADEHERWDMPDEERERAGSGGGPSGTVNLTHASFNGLHTHAHDAKTGPDPDGDGIHSHSHEHSNDNHHGHDHAENLYASTGTQTGPGGSTSSSDRSPEEEHERTEGQEEHERSEEPDGTESPEAEEQTRERAGGVDNSPWDAQKVWTAGLASSSPAKFFAATCAGRRSGDPALAASWALPHHYAPGRPPNAAGVSAALGRLGQTQGLGNAAAARVHLEGHERTIQAAKGKGGDGKSGGKGGS